MDPRGPLAGYNGGLDLAAEDILADRFGPAGGLPPMMPGDGFDSGPAGAPGPGMIMPPGPSSYALGGGPNLLSDPMGPNHPDDMTAPPVHHTGPMGPPPVPFSGDRPSALDPSSDTFPRAPEEMLGSPMSNISTRSIDSRSGMPYMHEDEFLGADPGINDRDDLRGIWNDDYTRQGSLLNTPHGMAGAPEGAVGYVGRGETLGTRSAPAEFVDAEFVRRREADDDWSPPESAFYNDPLEVERRMQGGEGFHEGGFPTG